MKRVLSVGVAGSLLGAAMLLLGTPTARAQDAAIRAEREQGAQEEAAQRAREEEARKLADSIVDQRQALGGRAFGPGFRETVKRGLLDAPIEALRQVERNGAQGDVRAVIDAAANRDSTTGSEADDLLLLPTRVSEPSAVSGIAQSGYLFVPVTPCRILDTRSATAGALVAGTPRSFVVSGSGPLFGAQGGNPSGCGVPPGTAVSAFVNFTAVNPSGAGNLRAWAYAAVPPPPPLASILNYAAVPGLNLANGVTAPLCDPLATTCTYDILVQADTSGAHLVADVLGYFRTAPTSYVAIGRTTATTLVTNVCTYHTGAVVAVDAPAPGTVLVRANVQLQINHTIGVLDIVHLHLGASTSDCSAPFGDSFYARMQPEPTGVYFPVVPISRLFTISTPGTFFYRVNAVAASSFDDSLSYTGIQATYHPN
jgi:hypothetical protein